MIWCLILARRSLTFRRAIECRFTLKLVGDMIINSQMHRTDKDSRRSSIIWPVWLNSWVFVYKRSGCEFETRYCHLRKPFGILYSKWPKNRMKGDLVPSLPYRNEFLVVTVRKYAKADFLMFYYLFSNFFCHSFELSS